MKSIFVTRKHHASLSGDDTHPPPLIPFSIHILSCHVSIVTFAYFHPTFLAGMNPEVWLLFRTNSDKLFYFSQYFWQNKRRRSISPDDSPREELLHFINEERKKERKKEKKKENDNKKLTETIERKNERKKKERKKERTNEKYDK